MRRLLITAAVVTALVSAPTAQTDTIEGHTTAARALAQKDPSGMVGRAAGQCPGTASGPTGVAAPHPLSTHIPRIPPTRAFDNLSFIGDEFVGVWVLQTDQGLILFDAFASAVDAQRYVAADLPKLGLDPKQIKYVVITHGHWDHFGGAGYFQKSLGARLVMGKPDWDRLSLLDPWGTEVQGQLAAKPDIALSDATMDLTLGNTTVKLRLTPGHSPGTVSALVPAREGDATHWLALWGGNAFQRSPEPVMKDGLVLQAGVRRMQQSAREFRDWAAKNGGVGVISTHPAGERTTRFAALQNRTPGSPHPFVMGKERTQDYFTALDHCMSARMLEAAKK